MLQRSEPRFASLDGLRIVGAVMVVTTHVGYSSGAAVNGPFAGLLARLDAGVALFFVISGFLLYRPHARALLGSASAAQAARARDRRSYARHRVARILPAAWLAVLVSAVLLPHEEGVGPWVFVKFATMTQIYSDTPSVAGLTQMWSLATEVAFYAVLPALAWLLARAGRAGRLGAVALILGSMPVISVLWIGLSHDARNGLPNLWLPAYLGWFGAGMALAVWHEGRQAGRIPRSWVDEVIDAPGTVWAVAAALFLLLSTRLPGPFGLTPAIEFEVIVKNLGYTALAVLIVLPCVHVGRGGSRVVAALGSRWARRLGEISYGVFCYHLIALRVVELSLGHTPFGGNTLSLWLLTMTLTLPAAWASYRWVEAPIMRVARRRDRRTEDAAGGDAGLPAASGTVTVPAASADEPALAAAAPAASPQRTP